MFAYTKEMKQAIYAEMQKIAKYRIYNPKVNIYANGEISGMDRKTLCAWHFERALYCDLDYMPFKKEHHTNDPQYAARIAQDFYAEEVDDLKRRAGEDGYKWYFSLPVKQLDK